MLSGFKGVGKTDLKLIDSFISTLSKHINLLLKHVDKKTIVDAAM